MALETLLWQEKYPSEVKAIIGLDWALPESYAHLTMHPQILRMARWGSQLGLLRYLPSRYMCLMPISVVVTAASING